MILKEERIGNQRLLLGDCLAVMPTLGRFDACITDPPYGKVKGEFDHAWTNRANMLPDVERWIEAISDAIKPNGTLWWFAWPSLAGRIEDRIARRMNVLSHVVWQKPAATGQKARKEALRALMPLTERIIMAEHYGADTTALGISGYQAKCDELRGFIFEPLRAYLSDEWQRAGLTAKDLNEATNSQMAGHYLTQAQWALPTEKNYRLMQDRANRVALDEFLRRDYEDLRRDYEFLRRDYEFLRRDYEDLRRDYEFLRRDYEDLRRDYEDLRRDYEDLRRYFDCKAGDQFSDVWNFAPNTEPTGHPTTKPFALMQYLVRLSVRAGGTCLDPFMGSGTTLVACQRMGRHGTGIELDPDYFAIACKRVDEAARQPDLLIPDTQPKPTQEAMKL